MTASGLVWLPVDHRLLGKEGHQMPHVVLGDKQARAIKLGALAQPVRGAGLRGMPATRVIHGEHDA